MKYKLKQSAQDSIFVKNSVQSLFYYLFYPVIWFISKLPFALAYKLSDFVYVILYYIVGYRKEVANKNLRIAFPNISNKEVKRLTKASTRHFCDSFIEVIKSMGMSKEEMRKRFVCENVELVNKYADSNRPVICLFGHQASYEWTMVLTDQMIYPIYAVYKPPRDKRFDALIRKIRMKFGAYMVAMKDASETMRSTMQQQKNAIFALVADQSPRAGSAQYFTKFFDQTSAVFKGGERFGKEFNALVVYMEVTKIKRGYYTSRYIIITPEGAKTEDWQITDTFYELLEAQIRRQPEYYMWSHKRWKATPKNTKRKPQFSPKV